MRFSTQAIHAGQPADPSTGAIMTPVYLSSTFVQQAPGQHKGYDYGRTANPTRSALEANIAALEEGAYGLAFASGLAAESTLLQTLSSGDHVVCGQDLYGGTYRLMTRVFERFGIQTSFVDATSLDAIQAALRPQTRLVWLETPSNPLLTVCDIAAIAQLAHAHQARVAVDNTFASPYLQQPLRLGADIVIHSTTKYLGGHSDVIGGALVVKDEALYQELKFLQNAVGAVPGPLDCFLVLRGIKTLAVRMRQHCDNALQLAHHLAAHPEVRQLAYPGLESSPYHALASRQMRAYGGMISLELQGGVERNTRFTTQTKLFALAESLGGVESLVGLPTLMTHASIPPAQRQQAGLPDALVRLSVGLEDIEDLIEDVDRAIETSR
ncbi:MAG: cystathionine gamma-synthase [Polaromonas sp.]|uniref:cystathionine gamma-synthase n=1 Tax=Polaromonas sp. TaxID=1869339 RepID=UPI002736D02E|nr:cystathionine gamma-synthase [Polaromonas sp.]MDP3799199.1 cystathionine gamma-synthase [Polaromonas sp.]